MSKSLKLSFGTLADGTMTISVPSPVESLTAENVNDFMNDIITKDIIKTTTGKLTSLKSAKIVETNINDLI